jgi:hypothetical protein
MEKLIYPYNFVSLGDEKNMKREPIKKGGKTGKLMCSLINKTPISIEDTKNIIIPASSLKGEIRNIIEVLTTSCIRVDIKNESHLYEKVPENFRTCSNTENLCFACRLFGSTGNEKSDEKNKDSYRGRVYFSDAVLNVEYKKKIEFIKMKLLLERPRIDKEKALEKYYIFSDKDKIRGRKFYWHQKYLANKNKNEILERFSKKTKNKYPEISFIETNQEFIFNVHFENLTDEELKILMYSIELEKDLWHKIGRAKSYGFGSCEMKINKLFFDKDNKYKSFENVVEEIDKNKYLSEIRAKYKNTNKNQIKELKSILSRNNKVHLKPFNPFPNRDELNKFKYLPTILEYEEEK